MMPCAAAATAQMEATRKDDNLIFERRLREEYSVRGSTTSFRSAYILYLWVLFSGLFLYR